VESGLIGTGEQGKLRRASCTMPPAPVAVGDLPSARKRGV